MTGSFDSAQATRSYILSAVCAFVVWSNRQCHPEPFKSQDLFFAGNASTGSLEVPIHGICNISVNPVSYTPVLGDSLWVSCFFKFSETKGFSIFWSSQWASATHNVKCLGLTHSRVPEPIFLSFCTSQPDLAANEAQLLRKIQLLCLMEVRSTWSLSIILDNAHELARPVSLPASLLSSFLHYLPVSSFCLCSFKVEFGSDDFFVCLFFCAGGVRKQLTRVTYLLLRMELWLTQCLYPLKCLPGLLDRLP